ncbi:MAG: 7TMR-DISMED2 domain-containing protein, partial [Pseudomonadota bacterium]
MRTFSILILAVFIAAFAWLQQYTAPLYDGNVYVVKDIYSDLTLERAKKIDWSREAPSPVNFGFTDSAFWFYMPLPDYILQSALTHMLEIDFPSIDELDVYLLDSAGLVVEQFHTGTDLPFASRPVWDDDWVFPIDPAQRPVAVLMRAATSNSLQMPIRL